jgi:hypothetical protein
MPYDNSLNHLLPPEPEELPTGFFGDDEENAYDERNDED